MKKFLGVICVFLSIITISCDKDDDGFNNIPPTKVKALEAQTLQGTIVRIQWDASQDSNGDEISYDVVVNDVVLANKTADTFIEFDAVQYLANNKLSGKESSIENIGLSQKAISLELVIKIKAFDTNGGVSEEVQVITSVMVNRAPGEFSFNYVNFDLYYYNWIEIAWTPAADEDGDIISYDIYFNDTLVKESYVIGSDSYQGQISYNENFAEYLDSEFAIRVVANDRSGGTKEISETYNFRGTDLDLGVLAIPFDGSQDFIISGDEPDNKIGYTFTIDQETGYSFSTSSDLNFNLYTGTGDAINGGYREVSGALLAAGSYYLEIENNYYYSDQDVSGSIGIIFRDAKASDVALGVLTIPFDGNQEFVIDNDEPDNKIGYIFDIEESTGFLFSTQANAYLYLYNSAGSTVASGYRNVSGVSLPIGTYYLEISDNNNYGITGVLSINLEDYNSSDLELGALAIPYGDTFNYNTTNEVDKRIRYNFEVTSQAGYDFEIISASHDTYLYLYNSSGDMIASNDDGGSGGLSRMTGSLNSGLYSVEVGGYGASTGTGVLSLKLQ